MLMAVRKMEVDLKKELGNVMDIRPISSH